MIRSATPRPLREANLSKVEVVLADVDGTLTTHGKLSSVVVHALERLAHHGLQVVLVSGRPSGWAECWARQLPVSGVIAENGGLYFVWRHGRLMKVYPQTEAVRRRHRAKLIAEVNRAIAKVKGARLSMDSAATEVDLAIDYAEEAGLGPLAAHALETFLRRRGVTAVRSSVHVNCWYGAFDKRSTSALFLRTERQLNWKSSDTRENRIVFVGDSFNDAPMFEAVPLSVGVANVLDVLPQLDAAPKFVTQAREGKGFVELSRALLNQRRKASATRSGPKGLR